MKQELSNATILLTDDDPDDCELFAIAWQMAGGPSAPLFAKDGVDLLEQLRGTGAAAGRPVVILLDLNMPRMGGHAALAQIKADPALRDIPVVIHSTSQSSDDVRRSYAAGAAGYVVKEHRMADRVESLRTFAQYWLGLVELSAA